MGSATHSLPKQQWTFISRNDNCDIYQNEKGEITEKHIISNDIRVKQQDQLAAYYYRYSTTKPLVKVYQVQYQEMGQFCSNSRNIEVYSEYIPYRLMDTRQLTHEQGLYVLSQAIIGFYQLYQRLGAFPVDHSLIGFNKDGFVKVWHSPNFAKNHFVCENLVLMSTVNPHNFDQRVLQKQQQEMMQDIWASVDTHTNFRPQLIYDIQKLQLFNFQTVKNLVDIYVNAAHYVPDRLKFAGTNSVLQRSKHLLQFSNRLMSTSFDYDRKQSATNKRRQ